MTNPGWGGAASEGTPPPQPRCVRHPDRPTALSCTRCGRPACPDCLRSASVGHQCVDCIAADQRNTPQARTVAGAPVRSQLPTPVVTYCDRTQRADLRDHRAAGEVADGQRRRRREPVHGVATFDSPLFGWMVLDSSAVAQGELFRVIGSGFLHFGLIHLAVNMFALWVLGRDTEIVLGRSPLPGGLPDLAARRVGVGADARSPFAFTAGASGAIFGIMGAQAVLLLRMRRSAPPSSP
ncbi:rhomboid family intramembrane serine protease [Rhodococcus hoagii]|nr:rhomboid family intramembrane serine protease [Prescottella equi]